MRMDGLSAVSTKKLKTVSQGFNQKIYHEKNGTGTP
jgi:hypothetical protein